MNDIRWLMKANAALYTGVAVIHIMCLRMLCTHSRHTHLHQRLLLMQLSIYHVLFAGVSIIYIAMDLNSALFPEKLNVMFYFVRSCIATVFIIIMHFITLDRLLEVYLHLRYPSYVTEHLVRRLIVAGWLMGAALGVAFALLRNWRKQLAIEILYYTYPALDSTFVFNAIAVYAYLYTKWRRHRKDLPIVRGFKTHFRSPKYLIPKCIVLTYFMFNVTGNALLVTTNTMWSTLTDEKYFVNRHASLFLFALSAVSDAIIYILLQQGCRRVLSRKISRWLPSIGGTAAALDRSAATDTANVPT